MNITDTSILKLEILIATMHRTSLEFLKPMFINSGNEAFKILIVNQTTKDKLLKSDDPNIRVVNAFETGLTQSRNLAIQHAVGDVCLIADDDVVYENGFHKHILEAHSKQPHADIITFQMTDDDGNLYRDYPEIIHHNKDTVRTANSVVISFKRKNLVQSNVRFNTNFGLGTTFQTGNEYVFLRNALKGQLQLTFVPKVILSHPKFSSGTDVGSDKVLYARAAIFYKYSGLIGYLRLLKHVFMLWKTDHFNKDQFWSKLKVGLKGIKDYKHLVKIGQEIP